MTDERSRFLLLFSHVLLRGEILVYVPDLPDRPFKHPSGSKARRNSGDLALTCVRRFEMQILDVPGGCPPGVEASTAEAAVLLGPLYTCIIVSDS